jgi:hypothetical protein
MRPLEPTPLTKTILNRWTQVTPVHPDFGRWVSYLSIDAAAVRAAALIDAQPPDQKSDEAAA